MSGNVIEVRGIGKCYQLGARKEKGKTFRELIAESGTNAVRKLKSLGSGAPKAKNETLWALKDVNFDVRQGEVVGIIGRNGAGKSTLLKVLSRITEPTEGTIDLWGRVGSLLEVGTGFHPELSGRENIYLNGAILGMRRQEIDTKFEEIVEFAEVERFIDTPVKHYSSGMYLRLAFAVAAHLEPEILVVDEVLAVGDASFQAKCMGRMSEVANEGRTVLFVSHNMAAIENLCERVIWMSGGQQVADGPTNQVLPEYLSRGREKDSDLASRTDRGGDGTVRFVEVEVLDNSGIAVDYVQSGQDIRFALKYQSSLQELRRISITLTVNDHYERCLLRLRSADLNQDFRALPANGQVVCDLPRLPLAPGTYPVGMACTVEGIAVDKISDMLQLRVIEGDYFGTGKLPKAGSSLFLADYNWSAD